MSKEQEVDVSDSVMDCINYRNLSPRPKWYYYASGALWFVGLTALFAHASLLIHRVVFFSIDQGPLLTDVDKKWKMLFIVLSIPAAAWSFSIGTQMVRRHGVFYRYHHYTLVASLFVVALVSALIVEYSPLKDMII